VVSALEALRDLIGEVRGMEGDFTRAKKPANEVVAQVAPKVHDMPVAEVHVVSVRDFQAQLPACRYPPGRCWISR
jgi:hypothetical protein